MIPEKQKQLGELMSKCKNIYKSAKEFKSNHPEIEKERDLVQLETCIKNVALCFIEVCQAFQEDDTFAFEDAFSKLESSLDLMDGLLEDIRINCLSYSSEITTETLNIVKIARHMKNSIELFSKQIQEMAAPEKVDTNNAFDTISNIS